MIVYSKKSPKVQNGFMHCKTGKTTIAKPIISIGRPFDGFLDQEKILD